MKDKTLDSILRNTPRRNTLRNGERNPYQVIKEDIYEMVRRRDMGFDEFGLAIYLRGKACRYGNPFKLTNHTIYDELGTTRRIVTPLKAKL